MRSRYERFLDNDVFTSFQRGFREGEMGIGGGGYGDYVESVVREESFCRVVDFSRGVVFAGIVVWFGCSLDDGSQGEGWCSLDEGDVEDFGGHSGTVSAFGV